MNIAENRPCSVRLLAEPDKNRPGAPGSPQRTWAENDMFRLLFLSLSGFAGRYRKTLVGFAHLFSPGTLGRTWGTRPTGTQTPREWERNREPIRPDQGAGPWWPTTSDAR